MQTGQKVNRRSFLRTCSQTTGGIAAVTLLARLIKSLGPTTGFAWQWWEFMDKASSTLLSSTINLEQR